jgi:hypothetical protein
MVGGKINALYELDTAELVWVNQIETKDFWK